MLATQHAKLPLIAPALAREVGLYLTEVRVDTDVLGTFAGEVPRSLPMGEAAVAKARLGMRQSGCRIGLASEGTIGPDPVTGLLQCDTEMVVLVDDDADLVLMEIVRDFDITVASQAFACGDSLQAFLVRADFPRHRVIVRPEAVAGHELTPDVLVKGVCDERVLQAAIQRCAQASPVGMARVESDLRAHCSPSRQRVIERAAEALALRIARCCEACGTPGWGKVGTLRGLPCGACGAWVPLSQRGVVLGCARCDLRVEVPGERDREDPGRCPVCNP